MNVLSSADADTFSSARYSLSAPLGRRASSRHQTSCSTVLFRKTPMQSRAQRSPEFYEVGSVGMAWVDQDRR
jgi:hypothetical protein